MIPVLRNRRPRWEVQRGTLDITREGPPHGILVVIPINGTKLMLLEIHPDDVAKFTLSEIVVDVDAARLLIAEVETNPQLGGNHVGPLEYEIGKNFLNCQSPENAASQESSACNMRISEDVMATVLIRLEICCSEVVVGWAHGEAECRARVRIRNFVRCSFRIDKRVESYP